MSRKHISNGWLSCKPFDSTLFHERAFNVESVGAESHLLVTP